MLRVERIGWAAAVVATGITCWAMGQDRKVVDPSMKILLENDYVRVQEHFVAPGQRVEMHSHPNKVIYALNDWKVRETLADGTTRVVEGKAGTAKWGKATQHAIENIGTTEVRNIVVELKGACGGQ
jgi:beta-alanine degradation protein BauB